MASGTGADFIPAKSKTEVVARLYSAADAPVPEPLLGPGSKERKSVLTATASRFDLPVNQDAAKDVLAREIVEAFGDRWDSRYSSSGQTITLLGLNTILRCAERRRQVETATQVRRTDSHFPDWFWPARTKLEAVRRISSVTGGRPQDLGPGSKERKSVLTDLVKRLGLDVDTRLSKTSLAKAITEELGLTWTDDCWSTGETIQLLGLNMVLAGAEGRVLRGHSAAEARLTQEASLLVTALAAACPPRWEGRTCVEEMLTAEYPKARETEWVGWYLEFIALPALVNAYGGGPRRIGATEFDYARTFVWDLKAHAQPGLQAPEDVKGQAPLNDRDSMIECIHTTSALGFLVLSGCSTPDSDGTFDTWHRRMRGSTRRRSEKSRALKVAFTPVTIDAYAFQGQRDLETALEQRVLTEFRQGRQQDGTPRSPKLKLNLWRGREAHYVRASQVIAPQ